MPLRLRRDETAAHAFQRNTYVHSWSPVHVLWYWQTTVQVVIGDKYASQVDYLRSFPLGILLRMCIHNLVLRRSMFLHSDKDWAHIHF